MENKEPKNTPELDKSDLKLKKHLMKWGASEEEALEFIKEHKEMPDDEEPIEEPSQEPVEEESPVKEGEPAPAEEPTLSEPTEPTEPSGEEPVVEEEPTPSEPVDPVAEPQEPAPSPMEEPSAEPTPAVEPEPQAEPIDYQAKYEEAQKTIDALTARFDSLEEALKKAGVLETPQNPVGVGSEMPEGNDLESSKDDILKKLNR